MKDLILHVKTEYFLAMKSGEKTEEFRLVKPYWKKQLEGRTYRNVVIYCGYPKAGDAGKMLVFPWRGFRITKKIHPHFGASQVEVFAIAVTP